MKKMVKRLLAVLLLVCMLASLTGCNLLSYGAVVISCMLPDRVKTYEGIEHYAEDCKDLSEAAIKLLPDPASFPDGEVVYHCRQVPGPFSVTTGISLFVTYPEELYPQKKETVLSEYEFLEAPIVDKSDYQIIPLTEFPYQTFQMKVTDCGKEGWAACKTILMIGYDDAACRITYCLFSDTSLDYIAEAGEDGTKAMRDFMSEYFYWI